MNLKNMDTIESYPPKLKVFLEKILSLKDETQKIELLIDYAEKYKKPPPDILQPPYPAYSKVPFCESGVFVFTVIQENKTPKFYFIIENPQGVSAKALAVILDKTLSGQSTQQILKVDPGIVYKIFGEHLSMGKNLGLTGMIITLQNELRFLTENKSLNQIID
jgi:cysteine desulfuration protein SufE